MNSLLLRILLDAYKLFDRRWLIILAAAAISLGVAEVMGILLNTYAHLPTMSGTDLDGKPIVMSYGDIVSAAVSGMAIFWFFGFVSSLAKTEIDGQPIKFKDVALHATEHYPKIVMVNLVTVIITLFAVLLALPAPSLGFIGLIFLIPSLLFTVWFSLVTPVVVMDNFRRIRDILIRSRILVHGYFWTVFIAQAISAIPLLASAGIQTNNIYYEPLMFIIQSMTVMLAALILVSAYANLRAAKGEKLAVKVNENIKKQAGKSVDV